MFKLGHLMFKKIAVVIVGVLCLQIALATTPSYLDSVNKVLNTTKNNTEKLTCLYTLSFEYGFIDPAKGISYGKQCLNLAVKENNLHYQLNAYNGIANAYETLANFDSAKYFHAKSHAIAKKMNVPAQMALTLFNVGLCYKQLGDYKNALNSYLTAYKLLEREKSYNPRIHFYIGEIYMRMGDFKQAEYQSRLGIRKCMEFKHDYIIYNLYVNLAKCHQHAGKLDSAIFVLNNALLGLQKHTDQISLSSCLNALGEIYVVTKEYEKAFQYFSKELLIHQQLKNDNGQYLSYLNLAYSAAFQKNKNVPAISKLLQQAENKLPLVKKNNDILLESYYKTGKIYEALRTPDKALYYYKLYYALHDSILNKEKHRQIFELQTKYETEKKEQQINSLQKNNLINRLEIQAKNDEIKKRNILIVLGLFSFFMLSFLVHFAIQKQKLKAILEKERAIKQTEEKERQRIAKDIHDDLGSGLSKINVLSELIIRNKPLDTVISVNAEAISETSKNLVINMRDLIWALDSENVTLSGLVSRIREYSSDYLEDFSAELKLKAEENLPNVAITKESHREILMTLKESLNNIVKHSQATIIEIETKIAHDLFAISVKDNGIGIPVIPSSGNGLKNMKSRIESIGGEFNISHQAKGTLIELRIPVENLLKV